MNNSSFVKYISESFKVFLGSGSRSNKKLKVLHGAIASDLKEMFGEEFIVKSLGIGDDKEGKIQGRYINKNVDITILKDKKVIAGIGVKFVMQNYSQNSNNYFENMLGETANIRSNNILYFQIFVIPDVMPYYDENGEIKRWETFSEHNAVKYNILSNDDTDVFLHTPNKTLLYVVKLPNPELQRDHKNDYYAHYRSMENIVIEDSKQEYNAFGNAIIFNDYELFLKKVYHSIHSI